MVTQAQLDANRRNAQHSTGPRTAEGKERTKFNALKHGLLAKSIILKGKEHHESKEEFDFLLSHLIDDFHPVGVLENMQVEKIAICYWRQARALRAESLAVEQRLEVDGADNAQASFWAMIEGVRQDAIPRIFSDDPKAHNHRPTPSAVPPPSPKKDPATNEPIKAAPAYPLPASADLLALVRYENMIERELTRALDRLTQLQKLRHQSPGPQRCHPTEQDIPDLYPTQRVGSVDENVTSPAEPAFPPEPPDQQYPTQRVGSADENVTSPAEPAAPDEIVPPPPAPTASQESAVHSRPNPIPKPRRRWLIRQRYLNEPNPGQRGHARMGCK